eukprot:scaffold358438_cov44-Prasinocladus_malaysianus.AAC.1
MHANTAASCEAQSRHAVAVSSEPCRANLIRSRISTGIYGYVCCCWWWSDDLLPEIFFVFTGLFPERAMHATSKHVASQFNSVVVHCQAVLTALDNLELESLTLDFTRCHEALSAMCDLSMPRNCSCRVVVESYPDWFAVNRLRDHLHKLAGLSLTIRNWPGSDAPSALFCRLSSLEVGNLDAVTAHHVVTCFKHQHDVLRSLVMKSRQEHGSIGPETESTHFIMHDTQAALKSLANLECLRLEGFCVDLSDIDFLSCLRNLTSIKQKGLFQLTGVDKPVYWEYCPNAHTNFIQEGSVLFRRSTQLAASESAWLLSEGLIR